MTNFLAESNFELRVSQYPLGYANHYIIKIFARKTKYKGGQERTSADPLSSPCFFRANILYIFKLFLCINRLKLERVVEIFFKCYNRANNGGPEAGHCVCVLLLRMCHSASRPSSLALFYPFK